MKRPSGAKDAPAFTEASEKTAGVSPYPPLLGACWKHAQLVLNRSVYHRHTDVCAGAQAAETQPRFALGSALDYLQGAWYEPMS